MKVFESHQIFNFEMAKTIAMVGFPNSGKSSILHLLTDFQSHFSYDSTYELKTHKVVISNTPFNIIDLPGIYTLNSSNPSEKISIDFLLNQKIDLLINVIDSTMLSRSLKLTLELIDLGIPMLLVLNFEDEAKLRGIKINQEKMKRLLSIPVVQMNARYGKGITELGNEIIFHSKIEGFQSPIFEFTHHFESHIKSLENDFKKIENTQNGTSRFKAIKALEGLENFVSKEFELLKPKINKIEEEVFRDHKRSLYETISYERHHLAMKISEEAAPLSPDKNIPFQDKIDNLISHPQIGYLILFSTMVLFFITVFYVGNILASIFEAPLSNLSTWIEPLKSSNQFLWYSLNGASMGIIGAVGIVMPYFLPLVFLNSMLEETGYMSRIVLLIDNLMHKIGLHGKSIIPFIMGLGCSVPALYSTRMMENRTDRLITAILIPFIPCSARLTVIFALSAAFAGPIWVIVIFLYIMLVIALGSNYLSKLMPESQGLIMEIIPLKFPSLKISFLKTWSKIREFIGEAFLFLIIGGIILGWIEYFNINQYLNLLFSPIVSTLLNLPSELGSTLLFGFFRKELILVMANQALNVTSIQELPLSISQIVVFIIFVSLYFPCLSTFIVLYKEFKLKITLLSSIASIVIAIISSLIFRIIFNFF